MAAVAAVAESPLRTFQLFSMPLSLPLALVSLLLALAQPGAAPETMTGTLQVCAECIDAFTPGIDAGAYKDIKVPGCGGACHCNQPGSPCWDPAVGASMVKGSPEHKAACCGLCAQYPTECKGWAISFGDGTSTDDLFPSCWVKTSLDPTTPVASRAHGKVRPGFSGCSAAWGVTFIAGLVLGGGAYVGVGVALGARAGRGQLAPSSHPHYPSWVSVAGLVADGVAYSRARAQGRSVSTAKRGGGSYAAVGDASRAGRDSVKHGSSRTESKTSGGSSSSSSKKTKKDKRDKSKSPGRAAESQEQQQDHADSARATTSSAAASATDQEPAGQAAGTAAGGGGRWVHIPS